MNYPLLTNQLPASIKNVWKKSSYVTTAVFLVIGLLVGIALNYFNLLEGGWLLGLLGCFAIVIVWFVLYFVLIPYRYKYFRYDITDEDLAFQKGFIFRSITYVPINRIQHIETEQGPFLRKENLMELVIHTAATAHRIAGLSVEDAMTLRAQIIDMVKEAEQDV